jgi:hypothetical protein
VAEEPVGLQRDLGHAWSWRAGSGRRCVCGGGVVSEWGVGVGVESWVGRESGCVSEGEESEQRDKHKREKREREREREIDGDDGTTRNRDTRIQMDGRARWSASGNPLDSHTYASETYGRSDRHCLSLYTSPGSDHCFLKYLRANKASTPATRVPSTACHHTTGTAIIGQ